jgi:hypothetical protein
MPLKWRNREGAERFALQDPRDMAKAALLESQSPGVWSSPLAAASNSEAAGRAGNMSRPRLPSDQRTMDNEFIQSDEWDAYVALDTLRTNGTRDSLPGASPMGTEPP